ncbi:hypothetical protein BJ165DRAFT_264797 [Panaeolus papilionaceus]|nr:hypothetical protein BJ165DRAFT_264797 [Panaeolus papilionaceus]
MRMRVDSLLLFIRASLLLPPLLAHTALFTKSSGGAPHSRVYLFNSSLTSWIFTTCTLHDVLSVDVLCNVHLILSITTRRLILAYVYVHFSNIRRDLTRAVMYEKQDCDYFRSHHCFVRALRTLRRFAAFFWFLLFSVNLSLSYT